MDSNRTRRTTPRTLDHPGSSGRAVVPSPSPGVRVLPQHGVRSPRLPSVGVGAYVGAASGDARGVAPVNRPLTVGHLVGILFGLFLGRAIQRERARRQAWRQVGIMAKVYRDAYLP